MHALANNRRRRSLHDSGPSCSHTSRVVRGGVGALIGGVLGAITATGVAVYVVGTQGSFFHPLDTFTLTRQMTGIGALVTVGGAVTGLLIAAHKPECA